MWIEHFFKYIKLVCDIEFKDFTSQDKKEHIYVEEKEEQL